MAAGSSDILLSLLLLEKGDWKGNEMDWKSEDPGEANAFEC